MVAVLSSVRSGGSGGVLWMVVLSSVRSGGSGGVLWW